MLKEEQEAYAKIEEAFGPPKPPTTEERIAVLEAQSAGQTKVISELLSGLISANQRLEALEAKPKGNRQGYPSTGVVWDGQVRLMAKNYGFTSGEIDEMQEGMDTYFLSLVGTSKAKVSSNWQLNARTWIKTTAKREGRIRQDDSGPAVALADDVPDPPPEALQALRDVLSLEPDELERDRKARLVWRACPHSGIIMKACNLFRSPWWDQHHDKAGMIKHERGWIEAKAAQLGIPAEAFAWPEI